MVNAIFIGSVEFSEKLLKKILENKKINIVGIVTKASSTYNSDFLSLQPIAKKEQIDCFLYSNQNKDTMDEWIIEKKPDIVFCFGWSHLLGDKLLTSIPHGIVGYHPALLPRNRGRHPIIWAIVLGLKETGSSFFIMDKGTDSGDIISQVKVKIKKSDDACSIYKNLSSVAVKQIDEICRALVLNKLQRKKQNNKLATYLRKRTAADGKIDWRMSFDQISRLVRALVPPYPGAFFIYGDREYKVFTVRKSNKKNDKFTEPGKIIQKGSASITVKCGDCFLEMPNFKESVEFQVGDYL